jgi:hypothetical protein
MVGVTGSIPVAPTILFSIFLTFLSRANTEILEMLKQFAGELAHHRGMIEEMATHSRRERFAPSLT